MKNIKSLLTLILFILSNFTLNAQYQSRIISEVNADNAGGTILKNYEEHLLIQFRYQQDSVQYGTGLMKTDYDGNPIWITKIDSLTSYNSKQTIFENDGTIVTAGHRSDGDFDKNIQIISLDENGNTLQVVEYGEDWENEKLRGFFDYFDGFLFTFNVPAAINSDKSEPVLVRLDSNFEVVWEKQFAVNPQSNDYTIANVWYDELGNIYLSGNESVSLGGKTNMWKIDQDGNEIWKYTHPIPNYLTAGGMGMQLENEDAFYLVNYVKEDISLPGNWHWVPEVIKLNYDGELEWSNLILNEAPKRRNGIFEKDNGDYIVYGRGTDYAYAVNKNDGWFVAHNQENERLYQRIIVDQRYDFDMNAPAFNSFGAGQELSDGSLVFVGFIATDNTNPIYSNQIWFVHTDSLGCLQPDCGFLQIIDEDGNYSTLTATEDIQQNSTDPLSVKIYPNPAQGVLSIELLGEQPQLNKLELTALTGKVLRNYSIQNQNDFTLDLPQGIHGIYFLKGHTDAGIWTKKIVIE